MKLTKIICGCVIGFGIALFGLGLFFVGIPQISEYHADTAHQYTAMYGEHSFPPSAQNIRYVTSSVGMAGRAWICRFEAPVDECQAYALSKSKIYTGTPPADTESASVWQPVGEKLPQRPDLASGYSIKEIGWFDVEQISGGDIQLIRNHSHDPHIWIDTRRGVFYGYWTD